MTDSDVQTETWKPIPGAGYYEASDQAHDVYGIRSVNRTLDGRFHPQALITGKRTGKSRYWQAKIRDDDRKEWTTTIHSLVLLAHVGPCPPGMEACHADDNPDNNRLSNLRWDYPAGNMDDRMRNRPATPKPPKLCIVCDEPFDTSGRRCAACREKIAKNAAVMLARGTGLQETADAVGYPPVPLLKLAQQLGGLRLYIDAKCIPAAATGTRSPRRAPHPAISPVVIDDEVNATARAIRHATSPWRRLRRVMFGREASRRNSDRA